MSKKQQVIINVGVSGSGKSTWSTNLIKSNPKYFRINRDDLRKMTVGSLENYYTHSSLNSREKYITELEGILFIDALTQKYSVIVDNTHLKPSYIQKWVDFVNAWNEGLDPEDQVEVLFSLFPETDTEILTMRVEDRDTIKLSEKNYIHKQVSSIRSAIAYVEDNFPNQILTK